ncbi:MAG: glycosyltransferase family 9 protein [Prevotellaceae bacterium]|jgi:ADP-heptose:LPS heptosyltransferase|nr:glycosyltransferase family 9 protein [Prevotellaceae bacterium]
MLFGKKKYRQNEVLKILVIRLSAMGDVAMTAPVLYSFIREYPGVKLSVLSQKSFGAFFSSAKIHFIGIELRHYEGLRGLYALFKILKKERFDLVIDLHDVLRSNILRFFFRYISGTKVFVMNKGRKDKRALTRKKNKVMKPLKTTIERYADVFKTAGFELEPDFKTICEVSTDISDRVSAILPDENNQVCIGIAPFAAHQGKIYPLEKMVEVLDYLSFKGFNIFLFGGRGNEKLQLQEWESKFPHCVSVAGRLSFKEELQLISKLTLMLSMDSANMHLASLMGTTVVSVWGATHPYTGFTGWGQSPENIVQLDKACRPCSVYGNKKCYLTDSQYACMREISPSMIIEKIMSVIGKIRADR